MQFRYRAASDKLAVYSYGTSNDVFTIKKSDGFVGIGTTSPLDLLHIKSSSTDARLVMDGHTDADAEVKFAENGTVKFTIGNDAATDSFVIGTTNVDTGKRFEINSSGVIKFNGAYTFPTADGSANQVLQTNGSGALSFGTISTSDSTKLPLSGGTLTGNLHVKLANSGQSTADGTADELVIENSGNSGLSILSGASNYGTILFGDSGDSAAGRIRYEHSHSALNFGTNGSWNRMWISSTGKVGINTTSPDELLQVELGDIKVEGAANASTRGLIIAHTGQTGNLTMLRQDSSGSRGILETTERNLRISAGSGGGTGTAETLDFFVNGSERMSIDTTGAIQIGGSTNAGFIDFDSQKLQLNTQRHPNTGTFVNTSRSHASIELNGADGGSLIVFRTATSNNTASSERMRIISDGSVLVNTTVDADNQTMRIRQAGSNADPALSLDSDTGDQSYYRYMKFYRKGQTSSIGKLDIDMSGSSIGLAFTSDARLKTVTGEADGLELITRHNPVKYVWKSEPDRHGAQGFLAQEVEQAYYETGNSHARGVSRPVDGEEHYMLDDTTLIPNLVKAIKELKDENDALKARVEALES